MIWDIKYNSFIIGDNSLGVQGAQKWLKWVKIAKWGSFGHIWAPWTPRLLCHMIKLLYFMFQIIEMSYRLYIRGLKNDFQGRKLIFSIFQPFSYIFSLKIHTKWDVLKFVEDGLKNFWKKISILFRAVGDHGKKASSQKWKSDIMKHPTGHWDNNAITITSL